MSRDTTVDVSIIMPVYNHEKYVEKALKSIFEQKTSYAFEVIIGEDCSTDNSRTIIKDFEKRYPDRVKAFYREKNLGGTKNVYLLYLEAKGRYIAVLEGDDYWCNENKIQRQAEFLDHNPDYIGVSHDFRRVDGEGKNIEDRNIDDSEKDRAFTWEDFLNKGFCFQSATLMFRNFFGDGGDYTLIYKSHDLVSDLTILTILLNRSSIYVLPEIMSVYRQVIKEGNTNARSISFGDRALSDLKTVRQLDMLRPYLRKKKDYNKRITEKKAGFLIEFLLHRKGYTFARLIQILKNGDIETTVQGIGLAIKITIDKVILHK